MTNLINRVESEDQLGCLKSKMIAVDVLLAWGATYRKVKAGEFLFHEGGQCFFYFQLMEGIVQWGNLNEEGKEFIQSIIEPGDTFGELPLFDGKPYAANALAIKDSLLLCLPKESFNRLILENPEIHLAFSSNLAQKVRNKFNLLKTIALENPEIVIKTLFNDIRNKKCCNGNPHFLVNLTRQQIANMTGLRVETVIRTIRHMSEAGLVEIDHGKIIL